MNVRCRRQAQCDLRLRLRLIDEILAGGLKRMREKRRADARDAEAARLPQNGNAEGNGKPEGNGKSEGNAKPEGNGKIESKLPPVEKTPPVVPETP